MNLKVKLAENATAPVRGTTWSAGLDLSALQLTELLPGEAEIVRTGVSAEIPHGHVGLLLGRSGLGARGLHVVPGVIDSDYRGEICVSMRNTSTVERFIFAPGTRIAQLLILPIAIVGVEVVAELSATSRGSGGFGSTDGSGPR